MKNRRKVIVLDEIVVESKVTGARVFLKAKENGAVPVLVLAPVLKLKRVVMVVLLRAWRAVRVVVVRVVVVIAKKKNRRSNSSSICSRNKGKKNEL